MAVVGWELLKNVFPGRPAVGATMLLNGIRFDVIGVLAKVGKDGNNGTNARIFVPVETMRNLFPLKQQNSESALSFINYRPLIKAEHMRSKEEIHQIIARRHGFDPKLEDAFEDWDTIENSQRVGKIFDAMDYFLGVVGFVTLALGAIGIVNIMLVSVAERTREIGLRKALGATYQNILTQFFIEGAFLTVFSGGIGLLIATAFVTAAGPVAGSAGIRHAAHRAHVGRGRDPLAGDCRHRGRNLSRAESGAAGSGRSHEAGVAVIRELGTQAYSALRHNKRRSILTMLGMAWGIATVVLLLAYGAGFERGLWAAFRSFGTNLVFVFPGRTSQQAGGTKAGSEVRLTVNDLDYIRDEVPLLKRLSPEVFKQMHRGLGHAQRQLRRERRVCRTMPACGAWNSRKERPSARPRTSPTRASLLSEPTPRRNSFPARMRSARASAWTASPTRSWAF